MTELDAAGTRPGVGRPEHSEVVTARPERLTLVCRITAGLVFGTCAFLAYGLRGSPVVGPDADGSSHFGSPDQVAMILFGLALAVTALWGTRPRVVAGRAGLSVRNLAGWKQLDWSVVTAVRLSEHDWCASLDLLDGDSLPMLAVQVGDGERSATTVMALRRLHAAAHESQ